MVSVEYRRQNFFRSHAQTRKLLAKRARNSRRGFPQPVPSGILANRQEYLGNCALDPLTIEAAVAQ